MSYLALYRKYRPADFNSVYGQEEVVTVIKNAIFSNKISHAYLFCGPRGTGKTTIIKAIRAKNAPINKYFFFIFFPHIINKFLLILQNISFANKFLFYIL